MTIVYVLLLTEQKYYIGKTDDVNKIHKIHFTNAIDNIYTPKSSLWTGIYRPISIEMIYENFNDDTRITLEYMNKYGIDNVRGGAFSEIYISKEKKAFIDQLINNLPRCHFCGSSNHVVDTCPEKNQNIFLDVKWDQVCCVGIFGYIGSFINPIWGTIICSMAGSYATTSIMYSNIDAEKYKQKLSDTISLHKTYFNDSLKQSIVKFQSMPKKYDTHVMTKSDNDVYITFNDL